MSVTYVLNDPIRSLGMEHYVTGRDRHRYFKQPLVPNILDTIVKSSPVKANENNIQIVEQPKEKLEDAKTKSVLIQTDFRESSAQTVPYTPSYIIQEGAGNPEVLSLLSLTVQQGLPVGVDELEEIEERREKGWFDGALPPISDEASFGLRRKLMEEQELREWSKKENEIKRVQNEKLYLLQSALIDREKDVEERNAQRIEEIKIKKTEQKNRLIAKIQRRKIKILRKLIKRRKELDLPTLKREIIEEYANFGSKVYAGITREGLSLDKIANKYEVQPIALTTYKGIVELSNSIKPVYFETRINVKKIQEDILGNYTRREVFHKIELKKAQEEIEGKHLRKRGAEEDVKEFRKYSLSRMRVRPKTPVYVVYPEFESVPSQTNQDKSLKYQALEKRELAVILIQRLLKGRFIQNIMYEGKEKRLALIEELLTVAKIPDLPENDKEEILIRQHQEKVKTALLEGIQGEIIVETLDSLAKELLRFQQERKIQEMVEKAEDDRKLREIEESGRRQAEETLREREDVLYGEVIRLHQGTVDNYLGWIMNNTVEKASTRQAVIMSKLRKEKMSNPVENYERKINSHETVIRDLVSSFLIPNVERSKLQKKIDLEEQRFTEAAKKALNTTLVKMTGQIEETQKK